MGSLTEQQKVALDHARYLAVNGAPVFLARPDMDGGVWKSGGGHQSTGYWLPKQWQLTEADPSVVDDWRPGMALCMVTGHLLDLLDVDPRSGGVDSIAQMRVGGLVPRSYGRQATPSGGTHDFMATLGVRSLDKVMPGVDVKAGDVDGNGRGIAFLAPTVKLSKTTGQLGTYAWLEAPDVELLNLLGADDTGTKLAELVRSRGRSPADTYTGPNYDGPSYADLSAAEQRLADSHVESVVGLWKGRLQEALDWSEGHTDGRQRGWEKLARDCAWHFAKIAAAPWTGLGAKRAGELYLDVLPDDMAATEECRDKWYDGIVTKAAAEPVEPPWWAGSPSR